MPTYEFVCKDCGRQFKIFTTVSGRDKAACPSCQSKNLQQAYKGMMFVKGGVPGSDGGGNSCSSGSCSSGGCAGCPGCA